MSEYEKVCYSLKGFKNSIPAADLAIWDRRIQEGYDLTGSPMFESYKALIEKKNRGEFYNRILITKN